MIIIRLGNNRLSVMRGGRGGRARGRFIIGLRKSIVLRRGGMGNASLEVGTSRGRGLAIAIWCRLRILCL